MSGTSLVVQRLELPIPKAGGWDSIPVPKTKILHAMWHGQNKNKCHFLRGAFRNHFAQLPQSATICCPFYFLIFQCAYHHVKLSSFSLFKIF